MSWWSIWLSILKCVYARLCVYVCVCVCAHMCLWLCVCVCVCACACEQDWVCCCMHVFSCACVSPTWRPDTVTCHRPRCWGNLCGGMERTGLTSLTRTSAPIKPLGYSNSPVTRRNDEGRGGQRCTAPWAQAESHPTMHCSDPLCVRVCQSERRP